MDRKTIAFCAICPVLFAGCGEKPPAGLFSAVEPIAGTAGQAGAFQTERPDSLVDYLIWNGNSPLNVVETFPSGICEQGDTAALCSDPFLAIETDRMIMELEFALAVGDTASADSLQTLLSDSSVFTPLILNMAGRMELRISPGNTVQPGDTVASVIGPPPDSVYIILPPEGHLSWPESLSGTRLSSGGLLVIGPWPGDSITVPGFYSVAHHFIFEVGLNTFLLTDSGDTVHVTVTGNLNGLRTVYSPVLLDSLILSSWN